MKKKQGRKIIIQYPFSLKTELHKVISLYVASTPNLPSHIKLQMFQILGQGIQLMVSQLGVVELLWRRERQSANDESLTRRNNA